MSAQCVQHSVGQWGMQVLVKLRLNNQDINRQKYIGTRAKDDDLFNLSSFARFHSLTRTRTRTHIAIHVYLFC